MDPQQPAAASFSNEDSAVVGRFTHLVDAELAKSILEGAGIACALENAHTVGVMPLYANALGGVVVRVAGRDRAEAETLLAMQVELAQVELGREAEAAADDADDEPESLEPSRRDQQATRAYRAAVLGLVVPVLLQAYSLYLLATLGRAEGELSGRGRRHVALAAAFDALLLVPVGLALIRR